MQKPDIRTVLTLILLLFSLSLLACSQEQADSAKTITSDISLEKIHEWEIKNPDVLPFPRFAGVLKDGSLVILDNALHTINHFDQNSKLVNSFGGVGNGPGEFAQLTMAAINTDGRVAVADISNSRITITDIHDGTDTFADFSSGWNMRLSWVDDGLMVSGHPFAKMSTDPGDIFIWRIDPETGEMDDVYQMELEMQNSPYEQISCTFCAFQFQNDGTFFTSPQDTSYRAFRIDPASGEETLFTRPDHTPVAFTEKEKAQSAERFADAVRATGMEGPDREIPDYKQRFINYFSDHQGRLWVLINVAEGETPHFDLFSPGAEYIGTVALPENAVASSITLGPENQLLIQESTGDNPDLWKAGMYRIAE